MVIFFSAEKHLLLSICCHISQLSCIILALLLISNDFENFSFFVTVKNSWKKNRRFCKASKIKLVTNWCNHWPQTDAKNKSVATNWRSDAACKKNLYSGCRPDRETGKTPGIFFQPGKTVKTPGILLRTRNFVILSQNLIFFYFIFFLRISRHFGIERQVPFQEIFNTCCKSWKNITSINIYHFRLWLRISLTRVNK